MSEQRYKTICEYTWGCIPVDKTWAIGTSIFQEMEKKLIERKIIQP